MCEKETNGTTTSFYVEWEKEGCDNGRTIVTIENRKGEAIQDIVGNGEVLANLSSNNTLLRELNTAVYIHPEFDLDGTVRAAINNCPFVDADDDDDSSSLTPSRMDSSIFSSIVFDTPVGSDSPGPLEPWDSYLIEFEAPVGYRLHIASMIIQSNDYVFGFGQDGLALFDDDGNPEYKKEKDVTSYASVLDAGVELNEKPGVGPNQPPARGGKPDYPLKTVRFASNVHGNMPGGGSGKIDLKTMLSLKIKPVNATYYKLNITNLGATIEPNPGCDSVNLTYSPGICVISDGSNPFYTIGLQDYGQGFSELARDGNPAELQKSLQHKDSSAMSNSVMNTVLVTAALFFAHLVIQ